MSLLSSLKRLFSGGAAKALFKRGLAKAHREDWTGAVVDYTAAIETPKAPRDVKAMAHLNRALAYAHLGDQASADKDLRAVLDMPDAPENVKTSAKAKLARWGKRRAR